MPKQGVLKPVVLVVNAGGINQWEPKTKDTELLDARNFHNARGHLEKRGGSVPYTTGVTELRPQRFYTGFIGVGDGARRAASDTSTTTTVTDADALFSPGELVGLAITIAGQTRRITANTYEAVGGFAQITWTGAISPAPTGAFSVFAQVSARFNTGSSGSGTALVDRAGAISGAQELYVADDIAFDGIELPLTTSGALTNHVVVRDIAYTSGAGTGAWTTMPFNTRDSTVAIDAATPFRRQSCRQTGRISWHRPATGSATPWVRGDPLALGGTPAESRFWIRVRFRNPLVDPAVNAALQGTTTVNAPGIRAVVRRPITSLVDLQMRNGKRWLLAGCDEPDVRNAQKGASLCASGHTQSDMEQIYLADDSGSGVYGSLTWTIAGGRTWTGAGADGTPSGAAGVLTKNDNSYNWAASQYNNVWWATFWGEQDNAFARWLLVTATAAQTLTFQTAAPNMSYPVPSVAGSRAFSVARPLFSAYAGAGQWRWNFLYDTITDKLLATNGRGPILELDGAMPNVLARTLLADTGTISALLYIGAREEAEDRAFAHDSLRQAPPTGRFLLGYNARTFVLGASSNPNLVVWSEPGEFNNVWMRDSEAELRDSDNSPIRGGAVLNSVLYVFKQDRIWALAPTGGGRFSSVHASAKVGTVCHESIASVVTEGASVLLFAAEDGIYAFDGNEPSYLSRKIERLYRQGLNTGRFWAMSATVWNARNWYMLACSSAGSDVNDLIIIYDFANKSFWVLSFPAGAASIASVEDASDREVVLVGTNDGYVMRFNTGDTTDDGQAVSSFAQTRPVLAPQNRAIAFRHIYIGGVDDGPGTITIEAYRNLESVSTKLPSGADPTATFDLARSLWGDATTSNATWQSGAGGGGNGVWASDGEDRMVGVDLPSVVGERASFVLRHDGAGRPPRIRQVTVEVRPRGLR